MAKLTLNPINSGYASNTALNTNFDLIETALENTLSRDGTTPNTMSTNLDLNNNRIINLAAPVNSNDAARATDIIAAAASAAAALVSEGNADVSEAAAAASAAAADVSEANALASEIAAAASASAADVSEAAALASEIAAAASAAAAAAIEIATPTHNATSKTTPVDADELPLVDSAASFGLKKLTWANLKTVLAAACSAGWNAATATNAGAALNGQFSFPTTQNPSSDVHTLDDYEEGTWAPSVGGTATYSQQLGTYVKIGKQVTVQFNIIIAAIGTGSTINISGLPFDNSAVPSGTGAVLSFGTASSLVSLHALTAANSSTFTLYGKTAAATSDANPAVFANGTQVIGTLTYFV